MTAATLTAETAADDLLTELRQLLQRHDGAASLDEFRALADDLTAALRRVRPRISRLTRQTAKPAALTVKPAAERAPEAVAPKPRPSTAEPAARPAAPAAATVRPAPSPKPAVVPETGHTAEAPAPDTSPVRPRPAARWVTVLHVAAAVLAVAWSTLTTGTVRRARRLVAAAKGAGRRVAARLARTDREVSDR